jgi:iron complex outermembrane receptor protein
MVASSPPGGVLSSSGTAYYQTAGKRESGAPVYTFGGRRRHRRPRLAGRAGQAHRSALCQRPEPAVLREHGNNAGNLPGKGARYTQVDLDAKLSLDKVSPIFNNRTFLQLNVINVFDETYVGGFSGTLNSQSTTLSPITYAQISPPRTIMGSISFGF